MQVEQTPDLVTPLPGATPAAAAPARLVRSKLLITAANATACYLLAYQLCAVVFQYATVNRAKHEHILGQWTVGGVHFILPDSAWGYTAVINVYAVGPLLMLLLGTTAFVLFWKWLRFRRGPGKLLVLWICFHAINYLLGGLLADSITQSGSAFVPSWAMGGMGIALVLGVLAGIGQVAAGFGLSLPFLLAQESLTLLQFDNRPLLVRYTIILPALAGTALLVLSRLPLLTTNEALHYATMGLLLVPLSIGLSQQTLGEALVKPRATHLAGGLIGLAVAALVAWRVALGGGISF
ncbi:MAG: hypothetical protein ACRYFX_30040 [Janthinobacterium lividum]